MSNPLFPHPTLSHICLHIKAAAIPDLPSSVLARLWRAHRRLAVRAPYMNNTAPTTNPTAPAAHTYGSVARKIRCTSTPT